MPQMKTERELFDLCDAIRRTGRALHLYLRHGHLEKVYENGMALRLRRSGIRVCQQHPLQVKDEDGSVLGDYFADLFVEDCLLVELKACKSIGDEHVAQLLGYLRASRTKHGLIVNFGAPVFQIRKFVL